MGKEIDGTVTPSFLGRSHNSHYSSMEDVSLRVGRVVAAYSPKHKRNTNGRITEYDVSIRQADSANSETSIIYPRVRVASLFGGAGDYIRWTPRFGNKDLGDGLSSGSEVMVMCINGNQRQAYIIGGIPSTTSGFKDAEGFPHLNFEFNGINAYIGPDGSFFIRRRGGTNALGEIKQEFVDEGSGASIGINKDGEIQLGILGSLQEKDTKWPKFLISFKDNTISLYSQNNMNFKTPNGEFYIETGSGVKVNRHSVRPDQFWLKGSDFRQQLSIMNKVLAAQLSILVASLTAASASMIAGASLNIASGAAAAPAFGVVGAQLATAGAAVTAMQVALQTFEYADSYLSAIHTFAD